MEIEGKEKEVLRTKVKLYKYIGETSRSSYERRWEHLNDMAQKFKPHAQACYRSTS